MYSGIEGHDLDAVSSFDCLLEFCAERKMLANVRFHASGHAAAENYRLYPRSFIGNFDEFLALWNSSHLIACNPSVFPFVGPAIQFHEQRIVHSLPEFNAQ